jgi:hypothetical protein
MWPLGCALFSAGILLFLLGGRALGIILIAAGLLAQLVHSLFLFPRPKRIQPQTAEEQEIFAVVYGAVKQPIVRCVTRHALPAGIEHDTLLAGFVADVPAADAYVVAGGFTGPRSGLMCLVALKRSESGQWVILETRRLIA